jgi:hypothetical protein
LPQDELDEELELRLDEEDEELDDEDELDELLLLLLLDELDDGMAVKRGSAQPPPGYVMLTRLHATPPASAIWIRGFGAVSGGLMILREKA